MVASYLWTPTQKTILSMIEEADTTARDFFVTTPFLIDCRDDAENFRARLTEFQRDFIVYRHGQGQLKVVGSLARPGWKYAMEKAQERYRALDKEAATRLRAFLDDWGLENGRQPGQSSKVDVANPSWGVDIVLPISGIRIGFSWSDLRGF